jgi:hypothetical protein
MDSSTSSWRSFSNCWTPKLLSRIHNVMPKWRCSTKQ